MRHIKKNMDIKIGSALDNDKAWSSDTKKNKRDFKRKKEPNEHSIVFKMEKEGVNL